jgi:hypothetical protein
MFRALYRGLTELERALQVHIHPENNIRSPRARSRRESAFTVRRRRKDDRPTRRLPPDLCRG